MTPGRFTRFLTIPFLYPVGAIHELPLQFTHDNITER